MEKFDKSEYEKAICKYASQGDIRLFPQWVFDALRPYSMAGVPLGISLLTPELCAGKCYERACALSLAFRECRYHIADVVSLQDGVTEQNPRAAEHAFIEADDIIYDTTKGLCFTREAYWDIEKPEIIATYSKTELMDSYFLKSIIAADFERDLYAVPLILPIVEEVIKNSENRITQSYKPMLLKELQKYKKAINFDGIAAEEKINMELAKTDPEALDRKLGIVRDRVTGQEISRNGKPNQYYLGTRTVEEIERSNAEIEEMEKDPVRYAEWIKVLDEQCDRDYREQQEEVSESAKIRLFQIEKNPTANFYDK